VGVTLLSFVFLVLIWGIVFVGSQRLLFGQIIFPERRQLNRPVWGFFNYLENTCPENVKNKAECYLLRVLAVTNATEMDDGYLLNVGTSTFVVYDRYVRRLHGVKEKDAKSRHEGTCFFVPKLGMPRAEQIAVQTMKWIRTSLPTAMDCVNEIARPLHSLLPVGLNTLPGERAGESAEDCADHPRYPARKCRVHRNEAKR
jgi:hypothetical protein